MIPSTCVFVVDDDLSARRGLARLLRAAGHEVRDFSCAQEFLDALGPEPSGCLVVEARILGRSRQDLQEELAKRGEHLRIIVVAAEDDPAIREMAQTMKATGFFRKPVDGAALLDAIAWAQRPADVSDNQGRRSRDKSGGS